MKKTLFICEGNIGRSQMAEGFYNHFIGRKKGFSAALKDYRKKYNFRPTDDIISSMQEEGIDIKSHKVKVLTQQYLNKAEKIIVLCDKKICPLFLLKDQRVSFYNVEDPFSKSADQIRSIRQQIKEIAQSLAHSQA